MRFALPLCILMWMGSGLASAATLLSFTPQGSVKKASQVQARFDTDWVDFGNGRAPSPFKVDCPARGEGRWLDARTFVHDFVGELPGGIRCTFTLTQQKNLKGEAVTGPTTFTFDTGGPALIRSIPSEGGSYVNEEDPMLLVFDAPIKPETLTGRLFFQVPQRADTIGFELVPEPEKYIAEQWPYLAEEFKIDPKFYLLIKPKERLPGDTDITLVIDKGVTSPAGVATQSAHALHFKTRPPFRASFYCQREQAGGPCTPHDDLSISFNDAVAEKERARVRVLNGKNQEVEIKREASYFTIPGPHPANSTYRIEIPADLKDERGRTLANAKEFPLTVRVGEFGPLLKFPGDFGVLEAAHPIWPLNMRKVEGDLKGQLYKAASRPETVLRWYKTIQGAGSYDKRGTSIFAGMPASEFKTVPLKKPNGPDAFEVIGVPMAGPGFYVMEVGSGRLGQALLDKNQPMFARAAVLVTNLAVHVKKGRQGSLVWVTSFDKGQPVPGADVAITDCKGRVLLNGKTDASGLFLHNAALPPSKGSCYGSYDYDGESSDYMVTASKDGDFSFTLTHWNSGIESWRFQLPWDSESSDLQLHSVLDRSLFRVSETVSMLHVARRRVKNGLAFPAGRDLKNQLVLQHVGSDKRYKMPVVWDDKGRSENAWKIPTDAPLGWYSIMIGDQESGRFRVDEFRLATMRGRLQARDSSLIAPKEIAYDFDVSYLSGGPAS
ncbi:MAG: MG2 domain-containing protein, partial [Pseudobdellovibrionaceae bacterium]|nr:MG2 domain-containing protein [Pseudobdellovibrionaceae bacterium]